MFVEATPNGHLAKAYRKALKEAHLKIRVVQRAGKSLKKMITKSDPSCEGKCNQNKFKCAYLIQVPTAKEEVLNTKLNVKGVLEIV